MFVGAAIVTSTEDLKRAKLLIDSGLDLIVIETDDPDNIEVDLDFVVVRFQEGSAADI